MEKNLKEECMDCGKEYVMYSKGTLSGTWYYGKDPLAHSHVFLCSKCAKKVIAFIEQVINSGAVMASMKKATAKLKGKRNATM